MGLVSHFRPGWVLWDVVGEHLDEAEFLFEQWEHALHSPRYNLTALAALERRLDAHLDGLVIGGSEVATRLLYPELANFDDLPRATVAALALLLKGEKDSSEAVIDTTLHTDGGVQVALSRALVLSNVEVLDRMLLDRFLSVGTELQRAIILEVLTGRGVDVGSVLLRCSESDDQRLVVAALEAATRFGRREMVCVAEAHLGSDSARVRTSAIKTSLALGSGAAWQVCRELARNPKNEDLEVLLLTAVLGQEEDHQILYSHLQNRVRVEPVLWTLGFCGTARAGDTCLEFLDSKDVRLAKVAAEALAWIGGFDLAEKPFQDSPGESAESETLPPLEEDDLNADLALDGVDDLPLPNRKMIEQWWKENRGRLAQAQRHLLGSPYSSQTVLHALHVGSLWRRHAIALELDIRTGGKQHISSDAMSVRQRHQLSALQPILLDQDLRNAGHW